jgi:hypothetical protein
MAKLRMPSNCVVVTGQHRGECITLIGTTTRGDSFVDALRKSLKPPPGRVDETDDEPPSSA